LKTVVLLIFEESPPASVAPITTVGLSSRKNRFHTSKHICKSSHAVFLPLLTYETLWAQSQQTKHTHQHMLVHT